MYLKTFQLLNVLQVNKYYTHIAKYSFKCLFKDDTMKELSKLSIHRNLLYVKSNTY